MAAVQQDGHALLYVKEQTPELCMAAVKQDGNAIRYIKEPVTFLTIAKQLNIEVDMDNDVLVAAQLAIDSHNSPTPNY